MISHLREISLTSMNISCSPVCVYVFYPREIKEYASVFHNIDLLFYFISCQEYSCCDIRTSEYVRFWYNKEIEETVEGWKLRVSCPGASKFKAAQSGSRPGHVRACQRKYDFVSRTLEYRDNRFQSWTSELVGA